LPQHASTTTEPDQNRTDDTDQADQHTPAHSFGIRVDSHTRQLHGPAGSSTLTAKEHDLLIALLAAAGAVVSRQHLLDVGWHNESARSGGSARSLDVHIATLRGKLRASAGARSTRIVTVRGIGYRIGTAHQRTS